MATDRWLQEPVEENRERIRAAGFLLRVHQELAARPLATAPELQRRTGLTMVTVDAALRRPAAMGLVEEMTGKVRGRVFGYPRYLAL